MKRLFALAIILFTVSLFQDVKSSALDPPVSEFTPSADTDALALYVYSAATDAHPCTGKEVLTDFESAFLSTGTLISIMPERYNCGKDADVQHAVISEIYRQLYFYNSYDNKLPNYKHPYIKIVWYPHSYSKFV